MNVRFTMCTMPARTTLVANQKDVKNFRPHKPWQITRKSVRQHQNGGSGDRRAQETRYEQTVPVGNWKGTKGVLRSFCICLHLIIYVVFKPYTLCSWAMRWTFLSTRNGEKCKRKFRPKRRRSKTGWKKQPKTKYTFIHGN